MTSSACRVLKLGTVRGQVCPDSRCTAFLAASSLVGLFDESKRGEGERVPNPGAALSLSFSLSLSAHRGPLASPRLSPSASQACSHSPPFLLDFTSHTLVCFETSHTLAFTPVFSDLRRIVKLLWRRQRPKSRPTSVTFRRHSSAKSFSISDGPSSNPRRPVSSF